MSTVQNVFLFETGSLNNSTEIVLGKGCIRVLHFPTGLWTASNWKLQYRLSPGDGWHDYPRTEAAGTSQAENTSVEFENPICGVYSLRVNATTEQTDGDQVQTHLFRLP